MKKIIASVALITFMVTMAAPSFAAVNYDKDPKATKTETKKDEKKEATAKKDDKSCAKSCSKDKSGCCKKDKKADSEKK